MAYEYVLYEKRNHIAYITINRPESMNALHPDASREMRTIFEDFRDDPESWIAVVTGAGERAFCAGFDLKYAAERGERRPAESVPLGGITRDWECWKPIIAAVNGYALGGVQASQVARHHVRHQGARRAPALLAKCRQGAH